MDRGNEMQGLIYVHRVRNCASFVQLGRTVELLRPTCFNDMVFISHMPAPFHSGLPSVLFKEGHVQDMYVQESARESGERNTEREVDVLA